MNGIVIDVFEPAEVKEEVKKSIPVTVASLSNTGFADYLWTAYDNRLVTVERKEVHDLVHRVDDLERQLKKAIQKVGDSGEVILLIEGIIEPLGSSTVLYRAKKDGSVFFRDRVVSRPYAYFMSFIYALDKLGVSTYWTASKLGTAEALVCFVKESNKREFTTFRRYIKRKPDIPQLNPQVEGLMSLCTGVGATRAQALIKQFGTVWNVLRADKKKLLVVDGIGEGVIEKIYESIGRKIE